MEYLLSEAQLLKEKIIAAKLKYTHSLKLDVEFAELRLVLDEVRLNERKYDLALEVYKERKETLDDINQLLDTQPSAKASINKATFDECQA